MESNQFDNSDPAQPVETEVGVENARRRAFIKRLAKAGVIAPAAALLIDAGATRDGLKAFAD